MDDTMCGLDDFGTHEEVGFEWTDFVKGLAGGLQGAGGLFSSKQPGTPAASEAEKQRLQKEKDDANRSKLIFGALAGVLGLGLVAALVIRR